MKILKLLNKNYLSIIIISIFLIGDGKSILSIKITTINNAKKIKITLKTKAKMRSQKMVI